MRTSPVHYIAPSALSITPNANDSQRDLAVYVARGAKIKVCYQPIAELGYDDASYKEWTLRGRNRRLADANVPYTVYARLSKTDRSDGYLVFAPQTQDAETGEWQDPYLLSPNTSANSAIRLEGADGGKYLWSAIPARQAEAGRSNYWWVKLGTVSLPNDDSGQRTVDLDTGILGTDQYNTDWYLDPDKMPEKAVREIAVERGEWTLTPMVTYTGSTGSMTPDGTLKAAVAMELGWTGTVEINFPHGQEISEPYHFRHLTRNRWLTQRLASYNSGYSDAELYEKLTTPSKGWEEENWLETSRVWYDGKLWECQTEGTVDQPSEKSPDWLLLLQGGEDGEDGYNVELTKSSDSVVIDPSGNVVGGYRTVSKDSSQNEFYTYRFHTSVTVMKGSDYLHLCGALDDDEQLGEGNFTVEAVGAGCELKVEGTTCYITGIWHCNDGDAGTDPFTSYNRTPEEYQQMRAMTEAVAHITLNIEGKTAVTKDYRLQLIHLPTDTVTIESHNEVAALNWSTKKNAWTNTQNIVIPLTASSAGQPVMFQTVNGQTGPDIKLLNKPGWLNGTPGFSVAWADYDEDGDGSAEYTADQHMAVEITIPIANILRTWKEEDADKEIATTNLLKFNVTTVVDGVEYENVVPFTLNVTTDKAVYVLVPSVRQVSGTMIGGTWDKNTKTVANARYSYVAAGVECNKVTCRLMSYDQNNNLTEITSASAIHDNLTFFINGAASSLDAFRNTGVSNTAVGSTGHNLFDELSEIVFAIKLDGNDYESEGVPILRNGASLSVGDDGNWYIGGVNTGVFAKGTEVTGTYIYYTDPMDASTPPVYTPATNADRGKPDATYKNLACPAAKEGKFIHYVSITKFSDSEETYVYTYGTVGTGNTITVIHDRDFYASSSELTQAQLKAIAEASWSESTPSDYSAEKKYLYCRDTARYYKNGAEQTVTVGSITYPRIVYTMLAYWGQDGSGVEFAYFRAADDSAANKPTVAVLNQRHAGTAKNPVIADWNGSDGGWYDDNPGFTTQGQVMYQSVNKYNKPTPGAWSGWSDPVIIDRYAQNAVRLDIDNEMDMVPTDSTGKITAARTVETVVHLYDGSKEIDISAATLSVSGGPASNVATYETPTASGKGKKLSWTFKKDQPMADVYNISIYYTYPASNGTTYSATFTVTASKGQAIYQLKPSQSSIVYSRQNDNTLSSANNTLSLSVIKIDGASSSELTPSASGQTIRYSLTAMPTSTATSSTVFAWPSDNSLTVASTTDNVYIAMFNSAGTLIDRETVPVVCDGNNGQNSVRLDIDNEMDMVPTDSTGKITAARIVETMVHLYDGSKEIDISAATLSVSGGPASNVATYETPTASGKGKKLSWAFKKDQPMADVYNISIYYTYPASNGTTYSATFTVTASKGQAIYQLKPSQSSIVYSRQNDNTLSSANNTLALDILKLDNGSTDTKAATSANLTAWGLTIRYSTSSMPTSKTAGSDWSSLDSANSLPIASTTDNVYIAMFNSAGTLIDRETVPVVCDGINGKNTIRLALDNEHEDFLYDGTRLVAPSGGASSAIRLYDGSTDITSSMPTPDIHTVSGCVKSAAADDGAYISNKTLYLKGISASAAAAEVVVKVTYNGATYYAKFTANKTTQDKYDIVCKPSSIAYNSTTHASKALADTIQTVSLSATGIGMGGTALRPDLSVSAGAGKLCVFWTTVSSNGTVRTSFTGPVISKAVTKSECENCAGIYFELRYYTSASDYRVCDYETVEIAKTKDGANGSALVVDLTNRNVSIPLDENGHLQSAMSLTTAVQAFFDTTEVPNVTVTDKSGKMFSAANGNNVIGPYTITTNGKTINITVAKWTESDMTASYAVTTIDMKVACSEGGNLIGTRTVALSLTAFKSGGVGDNAMFCDLMPQPGALKFARTASGGYDPSSRTLTVYLKNVDGKTTDLLLLSATGYTCRYSYSDFPATTSDGTAVSKTGTNADKITDISPANGNTLYLSLFSGTTRIDFEDVPIVSDGTAGKNSIRLALDNEHEDFLYDGTRLVAPSGGASSAIRLYDGNTDITGSMPTPDIHTVSGCVKSAAADDGAYISNKTLYLKGISASAAAAEVVVKVTYNGATYYAKFTANKTTQDKYDIVCKPSSIAYNSTTHASKALADTIQTVSLSATGIGMGGTALSPDLSVSAGAGKLCVFWTTVSSNGTVRTSFTGPVISKAVTKSECENCAGIYFELRYYTSASDYRVCDYETVEIAKMQDGAGNSAAYISLRGHGYGLSDNDAQVTVFNGKSTVTRGYADISEDSYSGDGPVRRGLALVTINRRTLEMVTLQFYDTYYSGDARKNALANAINALSDDVFVVLVSQDAIGWNDALTAALKSCGGPAIPHTDTNRYPFAFIGYKGLAEGYALQVQQEVRYVNNENKAYTPAVITAYIADGMFTTAKTGEDGADGQPGQPGDDAWTLAVSPSTVILNQNPENGTFGLPLYVDFTAKCGDTTATVGSVTLVGNGHTDMGLTVNSINSGNSRLQIYSINTVNGSYVTYGRITCSVPLSYGTRSTTLTVQIEVVVNLLGTWAMKVRQDSITEAGKKIVTELGPDGLITSAYTGAIERSATGLHSEFKEEISRAAEANKNLFGFRKGVVFENSIPFIQGYGIAGNNSSYIRVKNLGFNGVGGSFVVSFKMRSSEGEGYVSPNLCDVTGTLGKGTLKSDTSNVFVSTTWQDYEIHFSIPESNGYISGVWNGFMDFEKISGFPDGAYLYIRHLKIERGDTATAFCEADEDIAAIGQGQMITDLSINAMAYPYTYNGRTNVYCAYVTPGSFSGNYVDYLSQAKFAQLETGKVYTLSFWACSSTEGMVIRSHLYDPSIITYVGVDLYDSGSSGMATESLGDDGYSKVRLSKTWKQYFLRFYVAIGSTTKRSLIALRVFKSDNAYTENGTVTYRNGAIYMSDITLQEGYVMDETSFSSLIEQDARRITLVQQSGMKKAGIDIQNGVIRAQTDNFQIVNSNGEQTFSVDANGNLESSGDASFKGKITASAYYETIQEVTGAGTIDVSKGTTIVGSFNGGRIYLPKASDKGSVVITIGFYYPDITRGFLGCPYVCVSNNEDIYVSTPQNNLSFSTCVKGVQPLPNHMYHFRSVDGDWYMEGDETGMSYLSSL